MSADIAALRALAEAATPGPWAWEPKSDEAWPQGDESLVVVGEPGKPGATVLYGWGYDASGIDAEPQDRAFIAAANPEAVLALLDEVDRLRERVAELERVREADRAELLRLRATVARVEARADEWEAVALEERPHFGCFDMHKHLAADLRAALEGQ